MTTTDFSLDLALEPRSNEARIWAAEHLPLDAQVWGNSIAIEPRYVPDIVAGFQQEGLTV